MCSVIQHRCGGGQVGRDLGFHATERERADAATKLVTGRTAPVGDGSRESVAEHAASAEEAGIHDVEERPQLFEAILDRCAGDGEAERGGHTSRGDRNLGFGVLGGLGFVEDEDVPASGGEQLDVQAEERPGGEHEIRGGVEAAGRAVVDVDAEMRDKTCGLPHTSGDGERNTGEVTMPAGVGVTGRIDDKMFVQFGIEFTGTSAGAQATVTVTTTTRPS